MTQTFLKMLCSLQWGVFLFCEAPLHIPLAKYVLSPNFSVGLHGSHLICQIVTLFCEVDMQDWQIFGSMPTCGRTLLVAFLTSFKFYLPVLFYREEVSEIIPYALQLASSMGWPSSVSSSLFQR